MTRILSAVGGWWSLVEWAFRAHFAAFGVAVVVAVWERWINGGNWIITASLAYMLGVTWFTFAYSLFPPKRRQPAEPLYIPPARTPRPLPRLEDTQPTQPRYEIAAPIITSPWDALGMTERQVNALKAHLRQNRAFSWRTRPYGMTAQMYARVRVMLLAHRWGELYRKGIILTPEGCAELGIPSPAEIAND